MKEDGKQEEEKEEEKKDRIVVDGDYERNLNNKRKFQRRLCQSIVGTLQRAARTSGSERVCCCCAFFSLIVLTFFFCLSFSRFKSCMTL